MHKEIEDIEKNQNILGAMVRAKLYLPHVQRLIAEIKFLEKELETINSLLEDMGKLAESKDRISFKAILSVLEKYGYIYQPPTA